VKERWQEEWGEFLDTVKAVDREMEGKEKQRC